VTFELAASIFYDPMLLTVADLEHSEAEERWVSIGIGRNGVLMLVVHIWSQSGEAATRVRIISARKAAPNESRQYQQGL